MTLTDNVCSNDWDVEMNDSEFEGIDIFAVD